MRIKKSEMRFILAKNDALFRHFRKILSIFLAHIIIFSSRFPQENLLAFFSRLTSFSSVRGFTSCGSFINSFSFHWKAMKTEKTSFT